MLRQHTPILSLTLASSQAKPTKLYSKLQLTTRSVDICQKTLSCLALARFASAAWDQMVRALCFWLKSARGNTVPSLSHFLSQRNTSPQLSPPANHQLPRMPPMPNQGAVGPSTADKRMLQWPRTGHWAMLVRRQLTLQQSRWAP